MTPITVLVIAILFIYVGVSGKGLAILKVLSTDTRKITKKK